MCLYTQSIVHRIIEMLPFIYLFTFPPAIKVQVLVYINEKNGN